MTLPDDCIVREVDLPPGVRGLVAMDDEGFLNIYVNARLSHEGRLDALRHEIDHIENDDLTNDQDIRAVESRNRKGA